MKAPSPSKSFTVLIWLTVDTLIVFTLTRTPRYRPIILRWGTGTAAVVSVLAVAAYISASSGGPQYGVQPDPSYGGYAAYVTTFEANILAGIVTVWFLIAVAARDRVPRWSRRCLFLFGPLVPFATHTRSAVLAVIVGFVILIAADRRIRVVGLRIAALTFLVLVLLVILKPAGFTSAVTKFTTGGTVLTDVPYAGSGLYAGTGEVRIDGWKTAVGDLRGSGWVFGLGTNSFGQRHVDPTRPDIARSDYLGNLPLEIVYDAGVGGVAIAVAVGWVLVRKDTNAIRLLPACPRTSWYRCLQASFGLLRLGYLPRSALAPSAEVSGRTGPESRRSELEPVDAVSAGGEGRPTSMTGRRNVESIHRPMA